MSFWTAFLLGFAGGALAALSAGLIGAGWLGLFDD